MPLPVITFNQFVANISNSLVNGTPQITNLTPGSVAYAFAQALGASSISLQQLMVHIANITRLATSYGTDVDSFVGDWGLTRLPAVQATGDITLTRSVSGTQLVVPVGGICQTGVANTQFTLIADLTQPAYNVSLNAYVFSSLQTQISATVQAINSGVNGNIQANTLTTIVSGFGGVNSITNPSAFTNGESAETDAALKQRFVEFIAGLPSATVGAVEYAINSVQSGLTFQILNQLYFNGSAFPGGFTVVVDDGSGNISPTLLTTISNALLNVHAAGTAYQVVAPTDVTVNVSLTIAVASGYSPSAVVSAVQAAITSVINTNGVGNSLNYVLVGTVVQNVSGVQEYSNLLLNGVSSNVSIALTELCRAGTISITVA